MAEATTSGPVGADFLRRAGRILNSGQARTLILSGQIHDLFRLDTGDKSAAPIEYVSLVDFLRRQWEVPGKILVVYELNGPLRFALPTDRDKVKDAWLRWRTGLDADSLAIERMLRGSRFDRERDALADAFDENLKSAIGNPTVAFELLRQMCLCSRFVDPDGREALHEDLLILVEAADLALPESQVASLGDADRRRLAICHDWFSDPGFLEARDSVVLLVESRSLLHHRIARLPQVLEVEVPAPDREDRLTYLGHFEAALPDERKLRLWSSRGELADLTAGLSLHALSQLVKGASHTGTELRRRDVVDKVGAFLASQLGDDVVELEKPEHDLGDVVGFSNLKRFLRSELLPRFEMSGPGALPGAAVAGPIGSGKTFIFQAVAAELDAVVLTLKNLRSQWFGQTDVIFERLRRVLEALGRVVIFVDEADTQFGGVGAGSHETERRLTGKIQAMMSDPKLRGRVFWLLMTARIHRLSPDIRRPGRVGDLIIPILDPVGDDRRAFLRWVIGAVSKEVDDAGIDRLDLETRGYSAAAFAALRSQLKARAARGRVELDDVVTLVHDQLPPDIGDVRRYQTLQALLNCTRRSLLPNPDVTDEDRAAWADELRSLEARGIS
ncbi:MAG: ATP-binding protein [Thermoanaerobaculia bacterium]|nr:ATP-binding protein [Thermoanaerobaculia bacterium]